LLNERKVAHRNRRLLFWLPNCFFTLATPLHSVLFSCPYAPSKNEWRTPLLLPLDTDNPSHATTLYPTLTLTLTLTVKLSTLTLTRGRLSAAAVRQVSGGGGGQMSSHVAQRICSTQADRAANRQLGRAQIAGDSNRHQSPLYTERGVTSLYL